MSLAAPLVCRRTDANFDAALLALAQSRHTIYEHTHMAGEHCRAHRMLRVYQYDPLPDALEALYARTLSKRFCTVPVADAAAAAVAVDAVNGFETLRLVLHSSRSIDGQRRLSGENRRAHCMLPTDVRVEQLDCGSDTLDACYVNALTNYFVTRSASRL
ncbi:unnamed protein product [Hyaloperonospora brassicae]|uniref:RxLR effector candidate protein n=1 Tax=Hyaloperonospora brassicae TaxID=162125 RepID=A0AAV0TN47_HYABA|nr:unnamed protein product [Hyaloperonospora brassicae]